VWDQFPATGGLAVGSGFRVTLTCPASGPGTTAFQEDCGLRIWGTGWRPHSASLKHAFQVKFKKEYGAGKLHYPLFPGTTVTDTPALLTGVAWTCGGQANGAICPSVGGTGNLNQTIATLPNNGTLVYHVTGTVPAATTSFVLTNTATVAVGPTVSDPTPGNNTATDTDGIFRTLGLLDNFNRANAATLGANWSQLIVAGTAGITANTNQALCTGLLCLVPASAFWNVPTTGFTASQGAAFTFANTTLNNQGVLLKANAGSAAAPTNFIRVRYQTGGGGQVVVSTTTNAGLTFTAQGAALAASFVNGDTLTAFADGAGLVYVFKTTGTTTTYLGSVQLPTTGTLAWTTGGGRIGMQLTNGARVDSFAGGSL